MARLGAFLKDLTTHDGRIAASEALQAHVYGPYTAPTHQRWQPGALSASSPRYLWTDAFGVCNYISLAKVTGNLQYLDQADSLIAAVHNSLGRQRGGTHQPRLGTATDDHPTLGGLRIGKPLPEGDSNFDCDGQYYHYLTKWAFALNRMGLATGEPRYNQWAVELISSVHPHFVQRNRAGEPPRMFWKMSIDLSRPAVPSEGHLDPFDGLVTVELLRRASPYPETTLNAEKADFQAMVEVKYRNYSSTDPLDLGEALWLTHWMVDDTTTETTTTTEPTWAARVRSSAVSSLEQLWKNGAFSLPTGYRLAFREFGTTLGVQVSGSWSRERVNAVHSFWAPRVLERDQDITPVMMAASLLPGCWDKRFEAQLKERALK